MTFDAAVKSYQRAIEKKISAALHTVTSSGGRAPVAHVVLAGGKRIRPVIALLACEAAGGNARDAIDAAVAVELLHTFTLVHDDIMDNAPMRRSRKTVHTQWDANTAILAGDMIAALAFNSLARSRSDRLARVEQLFARAFVDVCDGQALDKELESVAAISDVNEKRYFAMIRKKTAALIAMAAAVGGCLGGADERRIAALARFGEALGIAFQIRDDVLDIAADQATFGKETGGDIREGKKTYLYVAAARAARTRTDRSLIAAYAARRGLRGADAAAMAALYRRTGVLVRAETAIRAFTRRAMRELGALPPNDAREHLRALAELLSARTH